MEIMFSTGEGTLFIVMLKLHTEGNLPLLLNYNITPLLCYTNWQCSSLPLSDRFLVVVTAATIKPVAGSQNYSFQKNQSQNTNCTEQKSNPKKTVNCKVRIYCGVPHNAYLKHRAGTVMDRKNVRNVILTQLLYISGICDRGKKGRFFF